MTSPLCQDLDERTLAFYRDVLVALRASGYPFLVGGAFAFNCWTGVPRATKDLDLFIRRGDYEGIAVALRQAGHEVELTYPHWLAKVHAHGVFIDLIFSSGNGIAVVDDAWFAHAGKARVLDVDVLISPVEEMIWSKAFIMERERYDGADVAHLLQSHAPSMDWGRLLARFDRHWRVLLSHLVLYGFIYPAERDVIPAWVVESLLERMRAELGTPAPVERLCGGTLLSREQYLDDVEQQGYQDGRVAPFGNMTEDEVARWTGAIPDRQQPERAGA
ncbi:MAG TPA: hypothetical protein VNO84_09530 [Burkholderiaceae bacterium]|nr:hypothetical protein [Burkholderiaceae bacterium]